MVNKLNIYSLWANPTNPTYARAPIYHQATSSYSQPISKTVMIRQIIYYAILSHITV